ncbi:MAG TPA: dihydrodipicolinate reductase C-terminal domain-containing protein [Gemmatimonadaceae bacterium]|nr:dihydrodipicolinate reductase C-terminal domain-containing protein [Gemmatimonadaceae bacterium]
MSALKIAVIGDGKMGRAVVGVAQDAGYSVTAVLGMNTPITSTSLAGAQVAIEFTEPSAAVQNIKACIAAHCPVVVGTTGWYEQLDDVTSLVKEHQGAMLWAANFSLGVHIFTQLVQYAGELLARVPTFDAHLIETHHTAKKDAPSGTALMLRRSMSSTWGHDLPITSVRVGAVPGTHELVLDSTYEQITLRHTARDRRVFAEGAVAAARWLAEQQEQGVFTIADMFGGKRV